MAKAERKLAEFLQNDFAKKDHLFYDQYSGEFFKASKATILAAELAVNRTLHSDGICPVSVFYGLIGIDNTSEAVWKLDDNCVWVDFDHIFVDYEAEYPEYHLIVMVPEPEGV